jgi:hypothetical protein
MREYFSKMGVIREIELAKENTPKELHPYLEELQKNILERQGFRLSELVDHLDRSLTQREAQLEEKARKEYKARDFAEGYGSISEKKPHNSRVALK